MIYLLAPAPKGQVSGGFRVNEMLRRRLATTGTGAGIYVPSQQVPEKILTLPSASPTHIVLDSLYLTTLNPAHLSCALSSRNHPTYLYFLLHFLPCMDLFLSSAERKALQKKEHALLALADAVIVPGPTLASYLKSESLYAGPIRHCPPGIEFTESDTPQADPWKKDSRPRLITLGTLSRGKGQLEILSYLQQMNPAFKGTWRLFGDLHREPEIHRLFKRKLRNSELKRSIHAGHNIPHSLISPTLRGADLLVSASYFESYGMAIAEAAAMGIPVLAYQVGETRQWIKEGENGFLIPSGDRKKFAATLAKLLYHPKKLLLLKQQAQKKLAETLFPTWELTFQSFLKTFEKTGIS
ncbi:glycosyltransferase family 4 protein [Nitrosococcus watsonii]|uniref:Glycosyl transferase group 1 n=1 Tax=Nitrosococcus watsoni (strain C-113) TaxID=105559 RepID=D8K7B5_NITWC|nr:glycosyltransferase [Nitrosococcus watsonii]ADJ28792.1 glycosyl transferase group 1 [Nitrosococcus watsonii C-113]